MTVNTYYLTFGFRVRLDSYMRMVGYTLDKLTDEIRSDYSWISENDNEILMEWFRAEHLDHGEYHFSLKDQEYVVRMFTHDHEEDHEKYVVVGVDMGEIDNFEGTITSTGNTCHDLSDLVKNEEWQALIVESESRNGYSTRKVEYGVQGPTYKNLMIIPTMVMTTDDCNCCS